jgi:N,N'-diacetyllegionaminate synthase
MPTELKIANRTISPAHPSLIIAEIGVNHDGSARRALELVEIAANAGADAVKLQIFNASTLMHGSSQFAEYQQNRVHDADPAAMLRRYELTGEQVRETVAAIRRHNLLPIATPFSLADVNVIFELKLPAIKIASPDLVNRPLLSRAAKLGVPLLISTGAATMDEIMETCDWLGSSSFALLHCVSSYPTPASDANLCWITELSTKTGMTAGFSDHTTDTLSGAFAVAAGARIIEKHLTYDRNAKGPDHAASADPREFAAYVKSIRHAEVLLGKPGKHVLDVEQDVRKVSRQSLVIARDLSAGEQITENDLIVQRPGIGIPAKSFLEVTGRCVISKVRSGTMLQWDMLLP